MSITKIVIFSDGGARGNPGPAGVGFIIQNAKCKSQNDNAKCKIFEKGEYIGTATNNQAEYRAVIEALKWVKAQHQSNNLKTIYEMVSNRLEDLEIECFLDSQLIVEQLNQRYKLKNEGLKPLFWEVRELVLSLGGKVTFKYIPREKNYQADKLVNQAIDHQKGEKI